MQPGCAEGDEQCKRGLRTVTGRAQRVQPKNRDPGDRADALGTLIGRLERLTQQQIRERHSAPWHPCHRRLHTTGTALRQWRNRNEIRVPALPRKHREEVGIFELVSGLQYSFAAVSQPFLAIHYHCIWTSESMPA